MLIMNCIRGTRRVLVPVIVLILVFALSYLVASSACRRTFVIWNYGTDPADDAHTNFLCVRSTSVSAG